MMNRIEPRTRNRKSQVTGSGNQDSIEDASSLEISKSAIRPDQSTIDIEMAALLGLSENQSTLQETSCEELITGINTPCDPRPSPQKLIGNINYNSTF